MLMILNVLKCCLVKYLNPEEHNPRRTRKADEDFSKKLEFRDIKFPVKIRDIHKNEENYSIRISAFCYKNKEQHPIYESKQCCEEKHVDLLL